MMGVVDLFCLKGLLGHLHMPSVVWATGICFNHQLISTPEQTAWPVGNRFLDIYIISTLVPYKSEKWRKKQLYSDTSIISLHDLQLGLAWRHQ